MASFSYTTDTSINFFRLFSSTEQLFEKFSYGYNEFSDTYLEVVDFGGLLDEAIEFDDFGSVASTAMEFELYGFITQTSTSANGTIRKIISSTTHSITRADEIQGITFLFQGKSNVYINKSHIGYGIVSDINGILIEKNTESYVGTGRAFGFGSKAERVVSSYNNSSVVSFVTIDYNLISSPEDSSEDYGSILDEPNLPAERDDYGFVVGRGLRPYGLTKLISTTTEKNTEDYVGTGSLFVFDKAKVFVLPKHIGRGTFKVRGAYSNLKNTESYVGTGSLFTFSSTTEAVGTKPPVSGLFRVFGSVVEKNTENYVGTGVAFGIANALESITEPYTGSGSITVLGGYSNLKNTENYVGTGRAFGFGSKAESTSVSYNESSTVDFEGIDYNLITLPEDSSEDYGSILDEPNLSSERDDYGFVVGRGLRPYGLTRFSGHLVEKNTEDYVGSGNLFKFGQIQVASVSPYVGSGSIRIGGASSDLRNTESYVGTGRAFGFGSKAEAIGTKPPVSGLFKVIGAVVEKNTESYFGTGSLFTFSSTTEVVTNTQVSTGLFKFNGIGVEKNTEIYVGTGRAFGFGSKAERTTASYNQSSIVDFESLDYGSINELESSNEDYGLILDEANLPTERDDYGLITGRGLRPYGLTRFSGHLVERNTESYAGTGSLFTFSSTTEAFSPKPLVSGLFRVSGAATQSITPTTEIGSGSLFTFISSTESETNSEVGTELFRFSGHLVERNTESYFGTGSLFTFSSTTEAVSTKLPVSGLFRVSGSATESYTPTTEIGSGSVFVYQKVQILDADDKGRLVSAYERITFDEVGIPRSINISGRVGIYFQFRETGSGLLRVNGKAIIRLKPIHIGEGFLYVNGSGAESITPTTEIGSGSLFAFVSSSESAGTNPPENTALFKFRGSAVQRNTESYVGVGIERINVESLVLIRPRYPGSGSISVTSTSTDSRNYPFIGSGNLFGFGSASEYLTNAYKLENLIIHIRGSAKETNSESYVGTGSVFTFQGATESKGSNPPENTILFKFTGFGTGRTQPVYVGQGKTKISEGSGRPDKNNKTFIISAEESSSVRTIQKPVLTKILGSAETSKPTVYKGRGRLFGFSGASESTSFSQDDTKGLFNISGTAIEKNTEAYRGSGTIFSIIGSSYSETAVVKGQTNLFRVTGSGSESFSEGNYTGSGQIVTSVQSKSVVTFTPKLVTTLFEFTGNAQERNSEAFRGSGTIGIFVSTGKSVFYDYKVSQRALRIFGNTFESFARSNYNGKINALLVGESQDRKKNYVQPKKTRIFII
jgi:hypothetical protein